MERFFFLYYVLIVQMMYISQYAMNVYPIVLYMFQPCYFTIIIQF